MTMRRFCRIRLQGTWVDRRDADLVARDVAEAAKASWMPGPPSRDSSGRVRRIRTRGAVVQHIDQIVQRDRLDEMPIDARVARFLLVGILSPAAGRNDQKRPFLPERR